MKVLLLNLIKKYKYHLAVVILIFSAGMYTEYKLFFPTDVDVVDQVDHPTTWNNGKINENSFTKEEFDKCINCANSDIEQEVEELGNSWIRVVAKDLCKSTYTDYKIRAPYEQSFGVGATYYFNYINTTKEISQALGIDFYYRYNNRIMFKAGPILPVSDPKIYGFNLGVTFWFNI